jgi:uncharacterized RDD family membrane protein YckC
MIDTRAEVETPEGVELAFSPAGPAPRALAYAMDLAIRFTAYLVLGIALAFLGRAGQGLFLIALFLLEWFYPVGFEVLAGGQTPGKRMLGLRVQRADGAPVGWSRSTVRSLLAFVDFLPFGFAAGLVAMLLGGRHQRLGDLAAGTVVVHVEPILLPPVPPLPGSFPEPPPGPPVPAQPLALDEQQAIMGFAERAAGLTPERARELADLLEPLTGTRGAQGVARLQALARALRGLE